MGIKNLTVTYSAYQSIRRLTNCIARKNLLENYHAISVPKVAEYSSDISSYFGFKKKPYAIVKPAYRTEVSKCPSDIEPPPYVSNVKVKQETEIVLKSQKDVELMRKAGHVARKVLDFTATHIKVGITTDELDKIAHKTCIENGAYPSPLLYKGYFKSICTSVNNVMIHGIPDTRPLQDGDIINIDVTVYMNSFHGDVSETYLVGNVDEEGRRLVTTTKQCLKVGIQACKPGKPLNNIGKAIEKLATSAGYSVCPEILGHGIGSYFHGPPEIIHVENDYNLIMEPGMTFTIEPCVVDGDTEYKILKDCWTVVSKDGSRSAQFEHTVLITETGVEILTKAPSD